MTTLDFGVIDHLDRQERPIAQTYAERLELVRRYDQAGFYGFHLTEHHFTPLGLAPSPLVFLAAASQVSTRIKLIPLVLILPLYHPLRLAGEIAMVDHLSNGRLEFATGRGVSPYELAYYGVNHLESYHIFREAEDLLMQALTQDKVTFKGDYFKHFDVPIEMKPLQQPLPPLWSATSSPEGGAAAARAGRSLAFLAPAERVRAITDRYREVWAEEQGGKPLPKLGLARHIFVADTDAQAQEKAEFGFRGWYQRFGYLWERFDARGLKDDGVARFKAMTIAGTPNRVADEIARQVELSGCNYFLTRFAYGELTLDDSIASLDRFTDRVMPQFGAVVPA